VLAQSPYNARRNFRPNLRSGERSGARMCPVSADESLVISRPVRVGTFSRIAIPCLVSVSLASAQEGGRTAAEELFKQGRTLMEAGKAENACPKFAESARLDPAAGTLLNLAECYEVTGRYASAWVRYKELLVLATQRGQASRVERASSKIAELEPKLSFITISVTGPVPGLHIVKDGVELGQAAWGSRLPVDPGEHSIAATAPGHLPWQKRTSVLSGSVMVQVPALVAEPIAPDPTASNPVRTIGTVSMIAGGVAALASGGLGIGAKLENDKARRDECTAATCSQRGADRIDRAILFGNVATGVAIAAGVLLVGGVVAYVLGRPKANAPVSLLTF
jgi:hypothetical protein